MLSKKRLFFLGLLLFGIMCISGVYSLNTEIKKAESGLSTNSVDIEIVEYTKNNQLFNENEKLVMPGDEIILIPRINNLGVECYLRTKIEYIINNEIFEVTDYIYGDYSSWTKKGDYYYYDSILPKKGNIDLFNKVIVPNLSSDYDGKNVVVHIVVETVQSKNFDGDWDNVEIKKSIDKTYDINYEGESSIIYEDNTNNHITLDKGFFDKLGNMLPGDNFVENIYLLNRSNSKNEYYLSIDYDNLTTKELTLLQNIKLLIRKQNGDILVDSNLASKAKHILGTYKKNEEENFVIEVSLPKNLDNDFSKIFTKVKWKFSYNTVSEVLAGNEKFNPLTGDFVINLSITIFIASSIGLLIVLIIGKFKNDNIEKN